MLYTSAENLRPSAKRRAFTLIELLVVVKDGAPGGDYRVTAEWPSYRRGRHWGPDKLGAKYAKAETSGLTVHVEERTNKLPPFELSSSGALKK